jgi:hypothetical protein
MTASAEWALRQLRDAAWSVGSAHLQLTVSETCDLAAGGLQPLLRDENQPCTSPHSTGHLQVRAALLLVRPP